VFVRSTNQKGAVAEAAIATEATKLGVVVSRPQIDARYDLIFDVGSALVRVQCKWATRNSDIVVISTGGSWYSPGRGYVRSSYAANEVDAIAAYCEELDECYWLPVTEFAHRRQVHLRLVPTKNGQTASLHWARTYRLPGAIAQLGERLAGSQKVVGSSPTGSTPIPLKDTVGMDEIDARIAHYVRRAEAGEETLITRWGKPVARLVPVQESLLEAGAG
jgi:prevent-host-death family protein